VKTTAGVSLFSLMKKKTGNDWLAEIMSERVLSGPPDVIPEGWLTLKQMCKQCNVSESAMRVRISRLLESGRLQKKKFRMWTGHQLMLTWHYHPAK
jgi:hypothetical protein